MLLFEGMGLVIKAKTIYIILIESNRNHALRSSTKERPTMSKILVAYFSAEAGRTARVAQTIAEASGGDIFEIIPAETYTMKDLNWKNPLSRCNREKIGKKDVPIKNKVENMDEYDLVFLGFPIWYFEAPNVIHTFVKEYDFTGKKIVLFATSGGSDINNTPAKLKPDFNGGEIVDARKFEPTDREAISAWVKSLI